MNIDVMKAYELAENNKGYLDFKKFKKCGKLLNLLGHPSCFDDMSIDPVEIADILTVDIGYRIITFKAITFYSAIFCIVIHNGYYNSNRKPHDDAFPEFVSDDYVFVNDFVARHFYEQLCHILYMRRYSLTGSTMQPDYYDDYLVDCEPEFAWEKK